MSIEANKAIARRLVEEVQNQQNISAMDELYDTDYVYHAAHGVPPTLEGNKQFSGYISQPFPICISRFTIRSLKGTKWSHARPCLAPIKERLWACQQQGSA